MAATNGKVDPAEQLKADGATEVLSFGAELSGVVVVPNAGEAKDANFPRKSVLMQCSLRITMQRRSYCTMHRAFSLHGMGA
jgi:hypothetical protein